MSIKVNTLILVFALFTFCQALKLDSLNHQYNNIQEYYAALFNQQQGFEQSFGTLQNSVDQALNSSTAANDINEKISILQNGILQQQQNIFEASTKLIPILVLSDQCQNMTEAQRQTIIQRCDKAIADIDSLTAKLATMPSDVRIQQMGASTYYQKYYLTMLKKVLVENCTNTAVLSPTVYQSNVYAPNWVLGNLTMNDFVGQYIQNSQTYSNVSNCPLETPFFNGYMCISCSSPYTLFNMETRSCYNCPAGTAFNATSRYCVPSAPVAPTPNATHPSSVGLLAGPYSSSVYDVPCPTTHPFYNSLKKQCVQCTSTYPYFNESSFTCFSCPTGSVLNTQTRSCEATVPLQPNATNTASPNASVLNPNSLASSPNDIPCPTDRPYFNGNGCINCFEPDPIFNATTLSCTRCQTGTAFDKASGTCVFLFPNASHPIGNDTVLGQMPPSTPYDITCPHEYPYFVGDNCIQCHDPNPLFDVVLRTCTSCPANFTYLPSNHTCAFVHPNATNPSGQSQTIGKIPPLNATDIPCPADHPYFNGTACLECINQAMLFNYTTKTCTSCPAGTVYDNNTYNCISVTLQPNATNPNASNATIGILTQPGQYDVPCPINAPFFNGTSCIQCQAPSFFDVSLKSCAQCPTGTFFNASAHGCISVTCPPGYIFNQTSWNCQVPPQNVSNFSAPNWFSSTPFQTIDNNVNQIKNGSPICPTDRPYYNGKICIQCTAPQQFNADTLACETCPAGTTFNSTFRKCEANAVSYITNPNSPNIVSGGYPKAQLNSIYNNAKAADPNLQDCPPATPYFNGVKCILCASPYPYFDMYYKECVYCPSGSIYDGTKLQCVDSNNNSLSPTLQSMAATAFTHKTTAAPNHNKQELIDLL